MIVRTYGRRNRAIPRTYSSSPTSLDDVALESNGSFRDSLSQESPHEIFNIPFSSQDSSPWSIDSEPFSSNSQNPVPFLPNGVVRKSKKAKFEKREPENSRFLTVNTTTLMETQEFGEMMEHVDEVNFALDGLVKGQPPRIRRASLLSLLSISATVQKRRLLRTHGMARRIIESVLGLSLDDSPSNLAAAALFFVLTSDGQDDQLLGSPRCICFLLKLLKPLDVDANKNKSSTLSCKLLGMRKAAYLKDPTKSLDSIYANVACKVHEILVSCKEMKSGIGDDNVPKRPEMNPKWLALLTMEKACISTLSLEDTSGTITKGGENFKEKLRELGGLDAVFEAAMDCHCIMERWRESSILDSEEDAANLQCLVVLLKCLKIMENATFLSQDNQSYLLEMKGTPSTWQSPLSFIELILSTIKILSGLSLIMRSSSTSYKQKAHDIFDRPVHVSQLPLAANSCVDNNATSSIPSSEKCSSTKMNSSGQSFSIIQKSHWSSNARIGCSVSTSETTSTSLSDDCYLKMRIASSRSSTCSGTSRSSTSKASIHDDSQNNFRLDKRSDLVDKSKCELLEDGQDPFAFDADDLKPSKWDILYGKPKVSQTHKSNHMSQQLENRCESQIMTSQHESHNGEHHVLQESPCLASVDEENLNLLADCLLAAVKVLMNLTNDNAVGCRKIALGGGLQTLSSLIARHFPSFRSCSSSCSVVNESTASGSSSQVSHLKDNHLNDQELDFLVAILGLLVNLVEKDGTNRLDLAATTVSLPCSRETEEGAQMDIIPLLCSVFLANQGSHETAGEVKLLPRNDDEAFLQEQKEAEKMIIEAYAALLLAFLSTESKNIRDAIASCLPDRKLAILVPVLERFLEFHLTLNMISPETHSAVLEVIESCRVP